MDFIVTLNDIEKRPSVRQLFEHLKRIAGDRTGICYYKYPLAATVGNYQPSIVVFDKECGILALEAFEWTIQEIGEVASNQWAVEGRLIDSPILALQDYQYSLIPRYEKYRELRGQLAYNSFVVLPLVNKADFERKFPGVDSSGLLFSNFMDKPYHAFWRSHNPLSDDQWRTVLSVTQGANNLAEYHPRVSKESHDKMGEAYRILKTRIAILDLEQHNAAIQVADGPQRIRGLAGTGKTIVLAMKAAYFHQRFPDKKVLYTFNTQSLYSLVRRLITRFYRQNADRDPDWDRLMVLHAWGGVHKEGVYSRTCMRNHIAPKSYANVAYYKDPFDRVCTELLAHNLEEEFDLVLVDEGQDFPSSFYRLIWEITKQPKRIVWAYDELQSLSDYQIRDAGDLFGYDEQGRKLVDFSAGTYQNGIEMDYVLHKAYRNPLELLMVAHGIGLGIYNEEGPLQMIDKPEIWNSIGYVIEEGDLVTGCKVKIRRPPENSPHPLRECYTGKEPPVRYQVCTTKDEQIEWVVDSVSRDVVEQLVPPEEIVIISLCPAQDDFLRIQKGLYDLGIPSIIPGISAPRDRFSDEGRVTLSTVYKAKGNEAAVVYVINFDQLYDYVEAIAARNRAFTSITRAKGWCRISGVGQRMLRAGTEIDRILEDIPYFEFTFPDMNSIRRLSTEEYARRAKELERTNELLRQLAQRDRRVFEVIVRSMSDELRQSLKERLQELIQ